MAELKTKLTQASVEDFINTVEDEQTRQDCWTIIEMMQKATGAGPQMWGPSIVGFGSYRYRYADGRQAEWMLVGFSPRKQNLTLYGLSDFDGFEQTLAQLGKHTRGKGCLYIKRLAQVHLPTLEKLILGSVVHKQQANPLDTPPAG
jgi:hypothetical protein